MIILSTCLPHSLKYRQLAIFSQKTIIGNINLVTRCMHIVRHKCVIIMVNFNLAVYFWIAKSNFLLNFQTLTGGPGGPISPGGPCIP